MNAELSVTTKTIKQVGTYVHLAGSTDAGLVRSNNQDNYFIDKLPQGILAIVADGMGGHKDGEVASKLAIEAFLETFKGNQERPPLIMGQAIQAANLEIYDYSSEVAGHQGMGTTLTALFLDDQVGIIGHVGDSRAYLIRDGQIEQLTRDHSWVADRVRQGILTEFEAKKHHWRNVITNAIGATQEVSLDLFHFVVQEDDRLLLCSDGISTLFTDEEILEIIINNNPKDAVEKLITQANELGSPDNITALVIHVEAINAKSKNYYLPQVEREPKSIKMSDTLGGILEIEDMYPMRGFFANLQNQSWYPFRYWLLACLGLFLLFILFSLQ